MKKVWLLVVMIQGMSCVHADEVGDKIHIMSTKTDALLTAISNLKSLLTNSLTTARTVFTTINDKLGVVITGLTEQSASLDAQKEKLADVKQKAEDQTTVSAAKDLRMMQPPVTNVNLQKTLENISTLATNLRAILDDSKNRMIVIATEKIPPVRTIIPSITMKLSLLEQISTEICDVVRDGVRVYKNVISGLETGWRNTVQLGETLAAGAKQLGQEIVSGAKEAGETIVSGAKKAGEGAVSGTQRVGKELEKTGKTIESGAKQAGKTIGSWFGL